MIRKRQHSCVLVLRLNSTHQLSDQQQQLRLQQVWRSAAASRTLLHRQTLSEDETAELSVRVCPCVCVGGRASTLQVTPTFWTVNGGGGVFCGCVLIGSLIVLFFRQTIELSI